MNPLVAFLVLGLILLIFPLAVAPVANTAAAISDQSCTSGYACFFFGNLGFFMIFFLVVVLFWWLYK